jgi:Protein of unknown function, DUF481
VALLAKPVSSRFTRRVGVGLAALLSCALACAPAQGYDRDKSDVVVLRNGNYLTGDIVGLEYGTLTLKTDQMGTLNIEWPAIRSLSSKFAFAVERRGGAKSYGIIATSDDGADLLVGSGTSATRIPLVDIERMSRYSASFWNRINGNLAVGFTYTKASDTSVGSINLNTYYRSTNIDGTLNFSSNTTKTAEGDDTYRAFLSTLVIFVRQSRNFWGLVGSLERDQELGIDARLVGGAVLGRRLIQMSFTEVTGIAGLVVAQESITSNPQSQTSLEAVLGVEWRVFRFKDPETALTLGVSLYPSLTESDRYRGNANLSLTHKIAGDFTLGLTGYWTADTHPPNPTAEKNDYGITFNLGYSFGE